MEYAGVAAPRCLDHGVKKDQWQWVVDTQLPSSLLIKDGWIKQGKQRRASSWTDPPSPMPPRGRWGFSAGDATQVSDMVIGDWWVDFTHWSSTTTFRQYQFVIKLVIDILCCSVMAEGMLHNIYVVCVCVNVAGLIAVPLRIIGVFSGYRRGWQV